MRRLILLVAVLGAAGCSSGGDGSSSSSGAAGSSSGSGTTGGTTSSSSGGSGGGGILVGSCDLVGSWDATVAGGAATASVQIGADHTLVETIGSNTGDESFTVSGDQISITDTGGADVCPASAVGVYTATFTADCNTFTFALVSDPCDGEAPQDRAQTLDGASFVRQ